MEFYCLKKIFICRKKQKIMFDFFTNYVIMQLIVSFHDYREE